MLFTVLKIPDTAGPGQLPPGGRIYAILYLIGGGEPGGSTHLLGLAE